MDDLNMVEYLPKNLTICWWSEDFLQLLARQKDEVLRGPS